MKRNSILISCPLITIAIISILILIILYEPKPTLHRFYSQKKDTPNNITIPYEIVYPYFNKQTNWESTDYIVEKGTISGQEYVVIKKKELR